MNQLDEEQKIELESTEGRKKDAKKEVVPKKPQLVEKKEKEEKEEESLENLNKTIKSLEKKITSKKEQLASL